MAWSSAREGRPDGGPCREAGTECALSRRDPTVAIGALVPAAPADDGCAALAGCDASIKARVTTAARTALKNFRISAPLPERGPATVPAGRPMVWAGLE